MMDIKITTTFNGREIRPSEFGRAMTEAIKRDLHAAAMEDVQKRARRIQCRTHGQTARLKFRRTLRGFNCEVSACCSDLAEAVSKAIS